MELPRVILTLSSNQARFLYWLLTVVPGTTAQGLRVSLGHLLKSMEISKK